jgi:hypothetical protein
MPAPLSLSFVKLKAVSGRPLTGLSPREVGLSAPILRSLNMRRERKDIRCDPWRGKKPPHWFRPPSVENDRISCTFPSNFLDIHLHQK